MGSPVMTHWNEEFTKATGLKILTWNWFGGYRHILAHKGFPTPASLKDQVPRAGEPGLAQTFELLGATR